MRGLISGVGFLDLHSLLRPGLAGSNPFTSAMSLFERRLGAHGLDKTGAILDAPLRP